MMLAVPFAFHQSSWTRHDHAFGGNFALLLVFHSGCNSKISPLLLGTLGTSTTGCPREKCSEGRQSRRSKIMFKKAMNVDGLIVSKGYIW
jgi:hypothetical protein